MTGASAREHLEQRELHVGEDEARVALRDQQRAAGVDVVEGERAAVDDAPAVERVDTEHAPTPARRTRGRARPSSSIAPAAAWSRQAGDGALRDGGVARDGVHDLAVIGRGAHERVGDAGVHLVEVAGALVAVVEALEGDAFGGEVDDGRVARGAHVPGRCLLERPAGGGEDEVGACRSEADDDDPGRHGYGVMTDGSEPAGRGGGCTLPTPSRTTHRP